MLSGDLEQKVGRVLDCISKGATALSEAGATVYTMSHAIQKQGISSFLHSEAWNQDATLPRRVHAPHTMMRFEPRYYEEKRAVLQLRLERAMHEQDASRVRHLACELDELEAQGLAARQGDEVRIMPAAFDTAAQTMSTHHPIQTARTEATNAEAAQNAARSDNRTLQSPSSTTHIPNAPTSDSFGFPRASCARHASAAFSLPCHCFHHCHLHTNQPHTVPGYNPGEYTPCSTLPGGLDNEATCATGWAGASVPWCQCAAYRHGHDLMQPLSSSPFTVPHTSGLGTAEQYTRQSSMVQFRMAAMATSSGSVARAHKSEDRHPVHATWSSPTETQKLCVSTHSSRAIESSGSSTSTFPPSRSLHKHPSICELPLHSMPSLLETPASLSGMAVSPPDRMLLVEMHALEGDGHPVETLQGAPTKSVVLREDATADVYADDPKEDHEDAGSPLKDIYEVEAVLDMRETDDKKREFLIKWRGWGEVYLSFSSAVIGVPRWC